MYYTYNFLLQYNIRTHTHSHPHAYIPFTIQKGNGRVEIFLQKKMTKRVTFRHLSGDKIGEGRSVSRLLKSSKQEKTRASIKRRRGK